MIFEGLRQTKNPAVRVYALIGYCVSTTAEIEHALFACFHVAHGGSSGDAAKVFFKVPSHEYRLKVADEALMAALTNPEFIKTWAHLLPHLGTELGASGARNLMAHNPVRGGVLYTFPATTLDQVGRGVPEVREFIEIKRHEAQVAGGLRPPRTENLESLTAYAERLTHLFYVTDEFQQALSAASSL